MKKIITVSLVGMVVLVSVPVLIAQLRAPEGRTYVSVALEDTTYHEVEFRNAEQDLQLAGLLFVPEGEGSFPAAVIIHGSGTSRRDNGWYVTLADHLQRNGIAVLLPDKRGSVKSEGDWRTASSEDLATDTVAAVEFLERQQEVPVSDVGIVGLSQGGHIAPIVAVAAPDISFLVNIVGGALPMHHMLVYEKSHNLRELGVLPGLSDLLAYPAAWSIIELRQKDFWDAVRNFDPLPYWQDLAVPSLVLYGEDDTNVPTLRSARRLRSLGNLNLEVRVYEGSGHALESPEGVGNNIIRRDALHDIAEFIRAAVDG